MAHFIQINNDHTGAVSGLAYDAANGGLSEWFTSNQFWAHPFISLEAARKVVDDWLAILVPTTLVDGRKVIPPKFRQICGFTSTIKEASIRINIIEIPNTGWLNVSPKVKDTWEIELADAFCVGAPAFIEIKKVPQYG